MPSDCLRARATLLLVFVIAGQLQAQSGLGTRVRAGLRVFKTLLAADNDLASKRSTDGRLLVLLVAAGGDPATGELASLLSEGPSATIGGYPVAVKTVSPAALGSHATVAGVFLAEQLGDDALGEMIRFGVERKVVVYSPFEGDVEKGVLGGVSIEATVRPFLNMAALRSSAIRIKPFVLKVAKRHE